MSNKGIKNIDVNTPKIAEALYDLYCMLEPGTSVELSFPKDQPIFMPNRKQERCNIIVMRPAERFTINMDKNPEEVKRHMRTKDNGK